MGKKAGALLSCGVPLLLGGRRVIGRQTSTVTVYVREKSQQFSAALLSDLASMMADEFASQYLLSFAITEFSGENVRFIRAVRQCAATSDPWSGEVRKALSLITLPAPLKRKANEWLSGKVTLGPAQANELVATAYRISVQTVQQDTFPRFLASAHCEEMRALHPMNMLLRPSVRERLSPWLSTREAAVVELWVATCAYADRHVTLASGWANEATVTAARALIATHGQCIRDLVGDEALASLVKRAADAASDMFTAVQTDALNALAAPYLLMLDSEEGQQWLTQAGLERVSGASASTTPDLEAHAGDDEDYAVGW